MKRTLTQSLKYMQGVRAVPTMRPEHLVDQVLTVNASIANTPATRQYFYQTKNAKSHPITVSGGSSSVSSSSSEPAVDSTRHRLAQLRLGGAQMLSPTNASIYNHNEGHPLYFAQTSPRQAGLCLPLVQALQRLRIHKLTELQGALIPLLLKGKHVIAHAETGTGKSFGIALATINRILRESVNHRLHTLILVPTEELALQYDKWLRHFGGCASQIVQAAFESIPLESQLAKLHNVHPHVLVGTPQRIAEITKASTMILGDKLRRKVDCLILDEADLILQAPVTYGRQQITGAELVDRLYRSRQDEVPAQMVATSATIDGATAQRLNAWMRNDKAVRLTTSFVEHTVPETISFYFFASSKSYPLKRSLELSLQLIFRQHPNPKILIFTSHHVDEIVQDVNRFVIREAASSASVSRRRRIQQKSKQFATEGPNRAVGRRDHNNNGADGHEAAKLLFPLAVSLQDVTVDPANPNRIVEPKQLVGRNREIYVQNGSNLSKVNSGEVPIGVGNFSICRGLHVSHVTHVIMYGDAPSTADFVHCAGRTGRMGQEGDVLCLFPPQCGRAMMSICNAVEIPFTMMKMKHVEDMLAVDQFGSHASESHAAKRMDQDEASAAQEADRMRESTRRELWSAQREELYDGSIRNKYVRERMMDEIQIGELLADQHEHEKETDAQQQQEEAAMSSPGRSSSPPPPPTMQHSALTEKSTEDLAWSMME